MKRLVILITIAMMAQLAQGQTVDSVETQTNKAMYDYLMAKHKKQNKKGGDILGSGLAEKALGIANASKDYSLGSRFSAGPLIYYSGVLITLC